MYKNKNNKFNVCFHIDESIEIEQEIDRIPTIGEIIVININNEEYMGYEVMKIINYMSRINNEIIPENQILIILKYSDIEVIKTENDKQ